LHPLEWQLASLHAGIARCCALAASGQAEAAAEAPAGRRAFRAPRRSLRHWNCLGRRFSGQSCIRIASCNDYRHTATNQLVGQRGQLGRPLGFAILKHEVAALYNAPFAKV
jgi:hypothetical protein